MIDRLLDALLDFYEIDFEEFQNWYLDADRGVLSRGRKAKYELNRSFVLFLRGN
jgi:hypothetical protein